MPPLRARHSSSVCSINEKASMRTLGQSCAVAAGDRINKEETCASGTVDRGRSCVRRRKRKWVASARRRSAKPSSILKTDLPRRSGRARRLCSGESPDARLRRRSDLIAARTGATRRLVHRFRSSSSETARVASRTREAKGRYRTGFGRDGPRPGCGRHGGNFGA